MYHCLLDDASIAEVLHNDSFQETGIHVPIPDSLRVHDDNRPTAADTEAGRFASFDAAGAEEESFALEE
jgi:hypothetical protein